MQLKTFARIRIALILPLMAAAAMSCRSGAVPLPSPSPLFPPTPPISIRATEIRPSPAILTSPVSPMPPGSGNLLQNGDFFQGNEFWSIEPSAKCLHCWMKAQVGDSRHAYFLAWERTQSGSDGAAIRAYQSLNLDVRECKALALSFDVRVDSHSLPNSGWWSDSHGGNGEYPAKITLAFTGYEGERFEWSWGFLNMHDGGTSLVNYSLVPAGKWAAYEANILAPQQWVDEHGQRLPWPSVLNEFNVSGSGWDFAAAISNLRLAGCGK